MGAFGFAVDLSLKGRGGAARLGSLFRNGEQGGWYDPGDLASMYQDSSATVPAAVDAPVGYLADKSGRGNHLIQSVPAARPVLRQDGGGRRYLEYDGVDDDLRFAGSLVVTTGSATTFVALRNDLSVANGYAFGGDGDKGIVLLYYGSTGQLRPAVSYAGGTATVGNTALTVSPTQNHIYRHEWDRPSQRLKAHLSGIEAISLAGSDLDLATATVTALGSRGGMAPKLAGRIYGAVIVSRLLSPAETARVETFLAARAGVTLGS